MSRRVVVTGIGLLTPYGLGWQPYAEALEAGRSGITPLAAPFQNLQPGYGGQVDVRWKELRALPGARTLRPATMTRTTFLAVGAVGAALTDAGLDPAEGARTRRGLFVGSTANSDPMDKYVRFTAMLVGEQSLEDGVFSIDDGRISDAMRLFTGFEILRIMNNMPAAHTGIAAGCEGFTDTYLGSTASGLQAVGRGLRAIQDGEVDLALVGGTGCSSRALQLLIRGAAGQLSAEGVAPEDASRPFDEAATGQVPGEAAAFLVLEDAEHAAARGAEARAELLGYADYFQAPPAVGVVPGPDAACWAAEEALAEAGLTARELDLVVPTGTGRADMDRVEAGVLSHILGDARPDWFTPSSFVGNPEAAAGPLGLASAVLALQRGSVPAAPNTKAPIPGFPMEPRTECTRGGPRTAWVQSFSEEGVAASVVLRRA